MRSLFAGFLFSLIAWFLVRYLAAGFYTVNQNERAIKTCFGRAERVGDVTTVQDPEISRALFETLETQNIISGESAITMVPTNSSVLAQLVAAKEVNKAVV